MLTDPSKKKQQEQSSSSIPNHFTWNDLDLKELYRRAKADFDITDKGPKRTREEHFGCCCQGHAAELFLLNHGFTNNSRSYKDLISPKGYDVEIKTTASPNPEKPLKSLAQRKVWGNVSDIVAIFRVNKKYGKEYSFHGIYTWNGNYFEKSVYTLDDL